jgi:hypothetical protein
MVVVCEEPVFAAKQVIFVLHKCACPCREFGTAI